MGVFLSVDPLVVKTGEPNIYGSANPVRFSDPSGLETCDIDTGICWDDYEDFQRGSVYARTRGAYKKAGVRPKVTYDPGSNTTVYENIPAALQGVLTEKSGVAWNAGASSGASGYEFFNGIKNHNSGAGFDVFSGGIGLSGTICAFVCVTAGLINDHPFVTLGELGVGASVNGHVTTKGACEQSGFSQGGSFVARYGGGVSVSTPLNSHGLWTVDTANVKVSASYGPRASTPLQLPFTAGTSYTWTIGC